MLRFGGNAVTYHFESQRLDDMPLKLKDGNVTFRVLVDRPMFEVVGGGGECFKTSARSDMGKPLGAISLTAQGDPVRQAPLQTMLPAGLAAFAADLSDGVLRAAGRLAQEPARACGGGASGLGRALL
ncbi:MAG: hypothetical protein NTV49_06345 [Kiritimatiellaeota bacterium]|nr:hypothetical protein [Kiritimatiellota bacterium]